MSLPFDGAISRHFEKEAPKAVRKAIEQGRKRDILADDTAYPYDRWMPRDEYEAELGALQIELMKAQRWIAESGARVVALFEGRDAAGKGGAIARVTLNTNPRIVRVVALPKPSDRERGEWYFSAMWRICPPPAKWCCSIAAGTTEGWWNRSSASVRPTSAPASSISCPASRTRSRARGSSS